MTIAAQNTDTQSAGRSFGTTFAAIAESVGRAIHGKRDVVAAALTCLLAEGHLLA